MQKLVAAAAIVFASLVLPHLALRAEADAYVSNQVVVKFMTGATWACRDSSLSLVNAAYIDSISDDAGYVLQLADTAVLAAVTA